MFNFNNFRGSRSTRGRASHRSRGRARPGPTRRPGTPPFWRRRTPSPTPVAGRTRSQPTPPPAVRRLSREVSPDRRIPTFCRTGGAGRPSLHRSPFVQRPASPPPRYEDFARGRPDTPHPVPIPEPREVKSEPEPTPTTSAAACQTDPISLPLTEIKQAVAEAVGVSLPPVMRANQGRFDHLLSELINLKTEVERIREMPRPSPFYSVACSRPGCGRSASLVSHCLLNCPLCMACSSLTPRSPVWLRNPQCPNCRVPTAYTAIRSDPEMLRALMGESEAPTF